MAVRHDFIRVPGSMAYVLVGGTAVGTVLILVFACPSFDLVSRQAGTERRPASDGAGCAERLD
jgi:hypothetical protein